MKYIPLYIHVPFCSNKCSYCTFYSITSLDQETEQYYINSLISQIDYYLESTESSCFKTIYIGGGTPSLLSTKSLNLLFNYLSGKIDPFIEEITMECNPEDITVSFLELLNDSPVNRLSLGVQSFNDNVLRSSGRRAGAESVDRAISLVTSYWKGEFSLDLITGLPMQDIKGQIRDVELACQYEPGHISCYSLILDETTPIYGSDSLPSSELEEEMWSLSREILLKNGYNHYEISNFSQKGKESKHNLQYWRMNEYLGCGPGAVGMIKNNGEIQRISNPHNLRSWLEGKSKLWNSQISTIIPSDFLFENYMMGLRTDEGINREKFKDRFDNYPEALIPRTVSSQHPGTFEISDNRFAVNSESRLFLNPLLISISEEIENVNFDFLPQWP